MDCSRASTRDPERWLDAAPPFSGPLARRVCDWIRRWEPDLTEAIKWNMLCFTGRKLVCGLSACRKHLGITFFRGTELDDPQRLFTPNAMSTNILGIRVTSLDDLAPGALRQLLHAAVHLDAAPSLPPPPKAKREEWPMPAPLSKALKNDKAAAVFFAQLKPTYQREYKVWISTAKQPDTIARRLEETLRALRSGKKWAKRREAAALPELRRRGARQGNVIRPEE
ncbi:MAG: YdeI/OmpD-associated family protein [Verrucomicrobiaceae bacterium]|nr:YdeI/OmpD-associated family protein [Verrucomicrobiaceae bacterium]